MFVQWTVMKKNGHKNFLLLLASLAFCFILNLSRALTLHQKLKVIYAASAVLVHIFHTSTFLIKKVTVESHGKCGHTSRTSGVSEKIVLCSTAKKLFAFDKV